MPIVPTIDIVQTIGGLPGPQGPQGVPGPQGPQGPQGIPAVTSDTGWLAMNLLAGWEDFGGASGTPSYRRIGAIVYLGGVVRVVEADTTSDITILPAGFRPPNIIVLPVISDIVTYGNPQATRIDVGTNGRVTGPGFVATKPVGRYVSLDGCWFLAA